MSVSCPEGPTMVTFHFRRRNFSKMRGFVKRKLKGRVKRAKYLQDAWRLFKTTIAAQIEYII